MILHFLIIFLEVSLAFGAWSSGDEKTIRTNIFTNYDRLTRPSEITNISIALNLLAINTLDLKTQQLSCTGWLTVEWTDSRLTWTNTAGTESNFAFASNSEIWFPEMFIDNSLADVNIINNDDLLYKIRYDGVVFWEVPRIFSTYCEVDITYFPFDTQTCTVEITSWAYSKEQVMLQHLKTEINREDFQQHGEFLFKSSSVSTSELKETLSDGSVEYFSQLDYHLILERRPSYYILSMIIPVVLTSYLMIIVFILPVESGEKVGFALTVLLAVAVLLTLVLDQMPSTALYVSLLSMFLISNLVLNIISVVFTVIVILLRHRTTEVPNYVKTITKCLENASCWNGCCKKKNSVQTTKKQTEANDVKDKNNSVKVAFDEDTEDTEYSWKDIALILDWFLFIYVFVFTTAMTLIFMMALSIGGSANK